MRRKLLALICTLALCFGCFAIAGCGNSKPEDEGTSVTDVEQEPEEKVEEKVDPAEKFYGEWKSALVDSQGVKLVGDLSAMLDTDLMLHNGAAKSSKMEKMSGIAESVFERYCLTEKDILITVSTSGKNAVPCEMAMTATKNGIPNISVVSSAYFEDKTETPKLYECSDVYIDNCVPHGDAVMDITGTDVKMGSVSTAASSFILQSVLIEAAEIAAKCGAELPIYKSGNIDAKWLYGAYSYEHANYTMLFRLLHYAMAIILGCFVLIFIPRKTNMLTEIGRHSFKIYLTHMIIVPAVKYIIIYIHTNHLILEILCIILGILFCKGLVECNNYIEKRFSYL
jgi:uncharacterized phosphosugar-binding protein